eukprot:3174780-Pyramimonas_sp.AAC.1
MVSGPAAAPAKRYFWRAGRSTPHWRIQMANYCPCFLNGAKRSTATAPQDLSTHYKTSASHQQWSR